MPLVLSIACAKEILLNIISAHDNKNRTISNIIYDLKKNHSCIYFFIYLREYIISLNIEKRERVEGFVSRY